MQKSAKEGAKERKRALKFLIDVSDIFLFYSGEGKGESEAPRRGGFGLFLKIPGGGGRRGVWQEGGGEGPGGCLREIGEGRG